MDASIVRFRSSCTIARSLFLDGFSLRWGTANNLLGWVAKGESLWIHLRAVHLSGGNSHLPLQHVVLERRLIAVILCPHQMPSSPGGSVHELPLPLQVLIMNGCTLQGAWPWVWLFHQSWDKTGVWPHLQQAPITVPCLSLTAAALFLCTLM